MCSKRKTIAIAIICLPILLCAGAFCTVVLGLFGSPYTELEADVQPYLVFADGTRFICNQTYYRGENPTDDEILGTIDSLIERPVQNADGSWRTEYYYIWYICEPG